jgi:hypothetical protein
MIFLSKVKLLEPALPSAAHTAALPSATVSSNRICHADDRSICRHER